MSINISLDQISAYVILEALTNEIQRWESMTEESVGEDALADYGNDMPHLLAIYEQIKELSVKEFGEHITDFTRG